MVLSEQLYRADESISLLKGGNDLIVAGYASVELVDKQGDIITRGALIAKGGCGKAKSMMSECL